MFNKPRARLRHQILIFETVYLELRLRKATCLFSLEKGSRFMAVEVILVYLFYLLSELTRWHLIFNALKYL